MVKSQRLTIAIKPEVLHHVLASGGTHPVFGARRRHENLVQVLGVNPAQGRFERVGRASGESPTEGSWVMVAIGGAPVYLAIDGAERAQVEVLVLADGQSMWERRRGLVPEHGLGKARVGLFGAGSVASPLGLALAQAGVGEVLVWDRDRFDTPNITRHVCDERDLGREKSVALAEKLAFHGCRSRGVTVDVTTITDEALDEMIRGSALLIATMDSPHAQFVINEAAVRNRVPAIFAGAFERACGGEVVVVNPGVGPCLFCAAGFRAGAMPGLQLAERRQAYQDAEQHHLAAEPGLGADIAHLASVAAAHALAVLDPSGSRATLLQDGHAFVLTHGGSKPRETYAELFHAPFEVLHARVVRDEPCPVCGYKGRHEVSS